MCVSWHIWELKRMWMGLESIKKCRLLRSSFIKQTFSIFTLAVFLIKLRFRANFLKIGSIRVAPPNLSVLPHTWWSPWQYGDLDRELGRTAKLVNSGHYGYRWSILTGKTRSCQMTCDPYILLNVIASVRYIGMPVAGVDTISAMKVRELFDSRKSMFWGYRNFIVSRNVTEWHAFNFSKWQFSHIKPICK